MPPGGPLGGEGSHLDWVSELLDLPPLAAQQLLDGSFDTSMANQPWHHAMFQVGMPGQTSVLLAWLLVRHSHRLEASKEC
jgi:hypothetical protein